MTFQQGSAFAVLLGMMVLFVWGRWRYDIVALLTLLAAVALGLVPAEHAYDGFGDEILVIIGSALVVSAAIGRSGVSEAVLRRLGPRLKTPTRQVAVLSSLVTFLSALMKNIGALAIVMPMAFQLARRTGTPPSRLLMPLAFGSLLGGQITLVGTSPNIIVARMREEMTGEPFSMFDYTPVGLGLAVAGLAFLSFGFRLLPAERRGSGSRENASAVDAYTSEARVPPESQSVGTTIEAFEAQGEGEVAVVAVLRERFRRYTPGPDWSLLADDVLVLRGEARALERVVELGGLELASAEPAKERPADAEVVGSLEAVVTSGSSLVGHTAGEAGLAERHGLELMAVSRQGEDIARRLRRLRFQGGDVLLLRGHLESMPETLRELDCLPLAERGLQLGRGGTGYWPVLVLVAAMILVALQLLPVGIAFLGAALVYVLFGALTAREAYQAIDWPILILLGALIPVSQAMQTSGATELVASWLAIAADRLPAWGALALMLASAMLVTPFLNNAAAVLVMAPIGVDLANKLGLSPDPFLMAVAVGSASDFLTPIGHQCNTLVMGPGGYHFGDYARLGLPLSLLVLVLGTVLIAFFWPLAPH